MGDKQCGQGECAMDGVKPMGWFDMVFKGSVESFDELFVGAVGLGITVEVLEADYFAVL